MNSKTKLVLSIAVISVFFVATGALAVLYREPADPQSEPDQELSTHAAPLSQVVAYYEEQLDPEVPRIKVTARQFGDGCAVDYTLPYDGILRESDEKDVYKRQVPRRAVNHSVKTQRDTIHHRIVKRRFQFNRLMMADKVHICIVKIIIGEIQQRFAAMFRFHLLNRAGHLIRQPNIILIGKRVIISWATVGKQPKKAVNKADVSSLLQYNATCSRVFLQNGGRAVGGTIVSYIQSNVRVVL